MIALRGAAPRGPRAAQGGLVPVLLIALAATAWLEWNADFDAISRYRPLITVPAPFSMSAMIGAV
jgi:hypothetical protein